MRLTPRLAITGGKPIRKRKNQGTGANRVASALRMGALSPKHSDSALGASDRRLARRKDASVAIFATARKLAILIYRMLKYGTAYVDEGSKAYAERFRHKRLYSIRNPPNQWVISLLPPRLLVKFQVSDSPGSPGPIRERNSSVLQWHGHPCP